MEFATYARDGNTPSFVKITMTNGESKTFETESIKDNHFFPKTFSVEDPKAIRAVRAYEWTDHAHTLSFLNEAGSALFTFNPRNDNYTPLKTLNLGANEEIVGIYGHKDDSLYFNAYGFIVRVNE